VVFQPFHQVAARVRGAARGTGLGLAISQRIVERWAAASRRPPHRRPVDVQLHATLPLAPHLSLPLQDSEYGRLDATATHSGVVLLVEDNVVTALIGAEMLKSLGVDVLEAEDGAQSLAVLEQQHVDLVLMDIQMPVLDGYATTRQVRERESRLRLPRVPIVALTANAFDEDAAQSLAAGMDAHLAKPYSRQQLRDLLQRWL